MFKSFVLFFSLIFILKRDEPFRNEEISIISLLSKVQILDLEVICSFWLIFYPLDPDPWVCIFLRIRIQEAKILRIQRIRILSIGSRKYKILNMD